MIDGLFYTDDFISDVEEKLLLEVIDSHNWDVSISRRVQQYGYKYDYLKREVNSSAYLGELPDFCKYIIDRLLEKRIFKDSPDQLIINEYKPGQGIAPHIDCIPCFKNVIASISLSSDCIMDFQNISSKEKKHVLLKRRSLLALSAESRYKWTHAIAHRKEDKYGDTTFSRDRRISLTFRNVILK